MRLHIRTALSVFVVRMKKLSSFAFQNAHSEDSDQTARMRRLMWIFSGRTCPKLRFLTLRLIFDQAIPLQYLGHNTDLSPACNKTDYMRTIKIRWVSKDIQSLLISFIFYGPQWISAPTLSHWTATACDKLRPAFARDFTKGIKTFEGVLYFFAWVAGSRSSVDWILNKFKNFARQSLL